MKKLLVGAFAFTVLAAAGPVSAADMPVKARVAPVAPYNWTGGYIGGNVGYSWGNSDTTVGYFTAPGGAPIAPPVCQWSG